MELKPPLIVLARHLGFSPSPPHTDVHLIANSSFVFCSHFPHDDDDDDAMDDRLFALLDDIAETAKGGATGHHDDTSNRFGDQDNEAQYYTSQQPAQRLRRNGDLLGQRRDTTRYANEDEDRKPEGEQAQCRHFYVQSVILMSLRREQTLSKSKRSRRTWFEPFC